jgi:hypothetical protein
VKSLNIPDRTVIYLEKCVQVFAFKTKICRFEKQKSSMKKNFNNLIFQKD